MLGKIRSKSADSRKSGISRSDSQEFIGETFGEAEDRIRALGEVASHLDKKEVSGEVLDQAIRNLFDKYSQEKDKVKIDPTQILFGCKVNHGITPPENCLSKTSKRTDLDRFQKLQRIFSTVPTFTNGDSYSVRDFLQSMNSLVESLDFQISEKEFEILLLGRLAPNIRSVMNLHRTDSLESLYANLLNLYDMSESRLSALSEIMKCTKNKFSSLRTYLEEILRLIGLSGKSKEQESQLLLFSMDLILPERVKWRLRDYTDQYESVHKTYPPVPLIINFVHRYRTDIDQELLKKGKERAYNMIEAVEPDSVDRQSKERVVCTECGKTGHNADSCYRLARCSKCSKLGHTEKVCRTNLNCKKCGRQGHTVENCTARCRLCNSQDHISVLCPVYPGQEPVKSFCSNCMKKNSLKLFHPSSQCVNSPKN